MKTPEEKYNNDPEYHAMVNSLVVYIKDHKFTPSEMREMVMFACIRYEQMQTKKPHFGRLISTPVNKSWFERQCLGKWGIEPIRPIDDKGPPYARNYIPTIPYQPFYVHDILNAPEPTIEEKANFHKRWGKYYGNEALPIHNIIAYAKNRKLNCLLTWLVKNHYIQEVEE